MEDVGEGVVAEGEAQTGLKTTLLWPSEGWSGCTGKGTSYAQTTLAPSSTSTTRRWGLAGSVASSTVVTIGEGGGQVQGGHIVFRTIIGGLAKQSCEGGQL